MSLNKDIVWGAFAAKICMSLPYLSAKGNYMRLKVTFMYVLLTQLYAPCMLETWEGWKPFLISHKMSEKKYPYLYIFSTFGSKINKFERKKSEKNEKIPKT